MILGKERSILFVLNLIILKFVFLLHISHRKIRPFELVQPIKQIDYGKAI